ncbi:MAG: hypothetical protein U9Q15_02225, partial [Patescibacteria group bacterium]|nr:hypothetical protein [Patescibacteria group bacterium]
MASTQMYLKIAEIRDNVVVMKDGSMRAVLKTSSVNFDLKSKEEQESIIYGYQQFLNSLEFPVQFLIKSRKLNIEEYLDMLRGKAQEQKNELIRKQTYEYIEYIARLVDIADIMRKDFYVIV